MNWIRATAQARTHGKQAASQAGSVRMFRVSPIESPRRSYSVLISQVGEQSRKFPTVCLAGLLLAALSGCGEDASRRFTERDYNRIDVADVNARNSLAKIAELEGRLDEVEAKLAQAEEANTWLINQNADGARLAAALSKQVSDNARVTNNNSIAAMTRRGACGTRTVRPEPTPGVVQPVVRLENIPCTEKDLSP